MSIRAFTLVVLLLATAAMPAGWQDTPPPAAPRPQTQVLTAPDAALNAELGYSAAIDGDTLVLGARWAPLGDQIQHGAVYVFARGEGGWTQQAKLLPDDAGGRLQFGRSVAVAGDTIVVGAQYPGEPGVAYVFVRSGGVWTQQARLTVAGGSATDNAFGRSVAVSGDTILVADPDETVDTVEAAGAVHVFQRTGTAWAPQARLTGTAEAAASYARFGWSVALDGDTAAVGVQRSSLAAANAGEVEIFDRSGAAWSLTDRLAAPDAAAEDYFGWSVALRGGTLVTGAPGVNAGVNDYVGAAYVSTATDGVWSTPVRIDAFDDPAVPAALGAYSYFGWSVGIEGGRVAVGAWSGQGRAVYVFDGAGDTWAGVMTLVPSGTMSNNFGWSLGMSGPTILVGGPSDDPVDDGSDSDNQGVGYVFELGLEVSSVTPSAGPTAGGTTVTVTGSGFEDGAIVTFGGQAATNVTVVDGETLTCVTPAHAAGAVDVVVDLPGERSGPASVTLEDGYLYADVDLKVLAFLGPAWASQGDTITLSNKTLNAGPGGAPATRVDYYLSADKTVNWPGGRSPADVLLGGWDVAALAARAFAVGGASLTIPADLAGGVYNLLGVVDGGGAIAERVETNNLKSRVIKIGSDLKVTALVVPRYAGVGGSIDVKDTTKNLPFGGGAPATETWFYLSADAVLDAGDVYLGKRAVAALARGASETQTTTLGVPADTVPARYYLLAVADGGAAAAEGHEDNNVKARPVTIAMPVGTPMVQN